MLMQTLAPLLHVPWFVQQMLNGVLYNPGRMHKWMLWLCRSMHPICTENGDVSESYTGYRGNNAQNLPYFNVMKRPDSIHQHHGLSTFSYNEPSSNVKASRCHAPQVNTTGSFYQERTVDVKWLFMTQMLIQYIKYLLVKLLYESFISSFEFSCGCFDIMQIMLCEES